MLELIIGGDFEDPGVGGPSGWALFSTYGSWSGTEIEVGDESLYFSGGSSTNHVVELDGNSGVTSVVEQSFSVTGDVRAAVLSFDLGGRNTSSGANDPVLIQVLDSSNVQVYSTPPLLFSSGSFTNFEFTFQFAAAGEYRLRFTEQGTDNSLGTILDNVSLMVCFASGTRIATPGGDVAVEDLTVGDLVSTMGGPPQPIRWIGSRQLDAFDLLANPNMRLVRVQRDALGPGMPDADLAVSPQHRFLVRSKVARRVLGELETLVPAKKLTELPGIDVVADCRQVTYYHFALQEHSVIVAQQAYTESLYVGPEARKMLGPDALAELRFLFPEHFGPDSSPAPARPLNSQGKLIDQLCRRLAKNKKAVVELSE